MPLELNLLKTREQHVSFQYNFWNKNVNSERTRFHLWIRKKEFNITITTIIIYGVLIVPKLLYTGSSDQSL